jgi:NAD(P)-dependent dehydrogenase (short-subunit alcohol dehydrogenase family)
MAPKTDTKPKIAVITETGDGLGRHMAQRMAQKGLRVAVIVRCLKDMTSLAETHDTGTILPILADISDAKALQDTFAQIDAELGTLDILINNAAFHPHRDFLEETPESFWDVMGVNLGSTVACTMLALDRMVPRGHGRIINVATFAGDDPTHLSSAYSVSKGACRILTKAIVTDLGDRFPNIVISDWVPGALKGQMGIPRDIDPEVTAPWGVALALWNDPDLNGATFVQDCELLPSLSLKRRVFNALTRSKIAPRRLKITPHA